MLTTEKQSQDLNQIAGVQDLSHENAAAVSGGAAVLFDGRNRRGARRRFNRRPGQGVRNLGNFNNRASSVRIDGGEQWGFALGRNFRGVKFILGAGTTNLGGNRNNNIESLARIV